jgi:hypothetical protein
MSTRLASRLTRIEQNTGTGARRFVVVEDRATAKRARGGISRRAPLVSDETAIETGDNLGAERAGSRKIAAIRWRSISA